MGQLVYRGEGLDVTIELGSPTIKTGILESLVINSLFGEAVTNTAKGQLIVFGGMLKYTRRADGLPFALPTWNSTQDEIKAAFFCWLELPEALGDVWSEGVDAIKNAPLPPTQDVLTTTNGLLDKSPAESSEKANRRPSVGKKRSA